MSYANRGMGFEGLVDYSNEMYKNRGIALINKRPTPVKILGRNGQGMIHGRLEKQSTVDYDGVYQGKAIVFETKSTRDLDRFNVNVVLEHQARYLADADKHGAISFILIEFVKHQTVYLLSYETFDHYLNVARKGGRKSIPIEDFGIYAYEVKQGRVPVDYLKVVDVVWGEVKANA